MTMNNVYLRLAVLVVLSLGVQRSMYGQTSTTNTNCNMNGNTANCTSTTTDDRAQQNAQAERYRQAAELGKSIGNALGRGVLAAREHRNLENYCKQHVGEPYARTWADGRKVEGTCPGTMSIEKMVESTNASFVNQKIVGYAESSGDTFTIHSERASDTRFHMMLANKQVMESFKTAGIKTIVYTNDADQNYSYDVVAGHIVTPAPGVSPSATEADAKKK